MFYLACQAERGVDAGLKSKQGLEPNVAFQVAYRDVFQVHRHEHACIRHYFRTVFLVADFLIDNAVHWLFFQKMTQT